MILEMINIRCHWLLLAFSLVIQIGCARAPIRSNDEAMRLANAPSVVTDDMNFAGLSEAIEKSVTKLEETSIAKLKFGPKFVDKQTYLLALKELLAALKSDSSAATIKQFINSKFEFYEVYGEKEWGDALISSYYEPVLEGSLTATSKYSQPLYELPADLISVKVGEFSSRYAQYDSNSDARWPETVMRGRLSADKKMLEPYLSRGEIETTKLNSKTAKVIAYVDPIDAFFLHTQGSGQVVLRDKSNIHVGYAGQNGYPYVSIGKSLFDKIPKEKMSRQKIEEYLRSLREEEAKKLMAQNPSFIFFQKLTGAPLTSSGVEVTAGRTIATDARYFPKGALAFLEFQWPDFVDAQSAEPTKFNISHRFVVDQDTGGAIRGPGRVDLFAGNGPQADRVSGVMRHRGRLYYLVPRQ